jgi:hypothetical protein
MLTLQAHVPLQGPEELVVELEPVEELVELVELIGISMNQERGTSHQRTNCSG